MQRDLLSRLAGEAERLCTSELIRSVLCRPGGGVALVFESSGTPALDIAPGPPRPRLAATRIRLQAVDQSHASLVGQVRRAFDGCSLLGIRLLEGERIVRFSVEGGQCLILEILGAASNLFWIDADGLILGRFRRIARPGGALRKGDVWRPPPPRSGAPASMACWLPPPIETARRPGLGAQRDILNLDALDDARPAELSVRADGPAEDDVVFVPVELLGDALLRRAFWIERHDAAHQRRQRLLRDVRRVQMRLLRLDRALAREEADAEKAETLRHHAEAILAGLHHGHRDGPRFLVRDPYATNGSVLEIPIDPALDNQTNASRLFRRAGRMERVREAAAGKRRDVDQRRARNDALAARLAEVARAADLDVLEAALQQVSSPQQRPARPQKRRRSLGRSADPRARRIRRYPLAGDWHAMVGGNGPTNDYLTFRVAAPHDFWLHAADYPGAHVVVRNSGRRAELPAAVLRQAAALAAHFSRAPRDLPVDVRWTPVRHIRKGKGLPAGAVLLPRFSVISVRASGPPDRRTST